MELNSITMAKELQVSQEEVDDVLFPRDGEFYPQRPLPFSDSDLCTFVASNGSELNAGMFRRMSGKSAEEFEGQTHS